MQDSQSKHSSDNGNEKKFDSSLRQEFPFFSDRRGRCLLGHTPGKIEWSTNFENVPQEQKFAAALREADGKASNLKEDHANDSKAPGLAEKHVKKI